MTVCEKCDQVHATIRGSKTVTACTGHISTGERAGQPCRNTPRKGQRVCGFHGGKAKQVQAAAEKRIAEAQVIVAARKLIPDAADLPTITNPLERLLELAAEADAFRESLRLLANKLQGDIRYRGTGAGAEQLRAEVATYQAAFKDTTTLLVAIARLDIEKMLARVTVQQAEQAMAAMRAGCDEAALTEEQKRGVMAGVGRHLRVVVS